MCPDLLLKIDGLGVQLRALARNAPHLIDSAMVYLEKMVEGVKEKHESSASLRSPPKAVLQNPPKTIIAGRAAIAGKPQYSAKRSDYNICNGSSRGRLR